MIDASLREIAHALGGDVVGRQVLAPGPGHGPRDRSLSIKLDASARDGFMIHSFAGDEWRDCKDYVKSRLGMAQFDPPERVAKPTSFKDDSAARIERAREIWDASIDSRGTLAEAYLRSQGLELEGDIAGAVLRFHPHCPWGDKATGRTIFVPAMIAVMRSIATDEITGVRRTRLPHVVPKPERRMLGIAAGGCVELDHDDTVLAGLHVGKASRRACRRANSG